MRTSHHICSLVGSSRGAREFRLLHASAQRWGEYRFLVACPPSLAEELSAMKHVSPLPIVDSALVYHDAEPRDYFSKKCKKLLGCKVPLCQAALRLGEPGFYMDADSIIVSPLEEPLDRWAHDHHILASPHYLRSSATAQCGVYNAGMFYTTSADFLAQWESELERGEDDFADQTAFNRVLARAQVRDLPLKFNVGWWRYSPDAVPFERRRLLLRGVEQRQH